MGGCVKVVRNRKANVVVPGGYENDQDKLMGLEREQLGRAGGSLEQAVNEPFLTFMRRNRKGRWDKSSGRCQQNRTYYKCVLVKKIATLLHRHQKHCASNFGLNCVAFPAVSAYGGV